MSQTNTPILHVGLAVAKASLQLDLAGQPHSLANDAQGHARLLKHLRAHPGTHVVCEATGGYEQPAVRVLHAAQIPVSVVEAGRIRHFAKAKGLRAKTDPIDAAVLSEYGRLLPLLTTLTAESNRAAHCTDKFCVRQARQLRRALEKQLEACATAIAALIAADAILQAQAERLDAIPGVGVVTAATVLAELPGLGKISDEAAAALVGVAPYNRDRGDHTGGGAAVRCALYMATLSAVR